MRVRAWQGSKFLEFNRNIPDSADFEENLRRQGLCQHTRNLCSARPFLSNQASEERAPRISRQAGALEINLFRLNTMTFSYLSCIMKEFSVFDHVLVTAANFDE